MQRGDELWLPDGRIVPYRRVDPYRRVADAPRRRAAVPSAPERSRASVRAGAVCERRGAAPAGDRGRHLDLVV